MSRIQDILNKAERDGGVRRTHGPLIDGGDGREASPVFVEEVRLASPAPPRPRAADTQAPAATSVETPKVVQAGVLSPMLVAVLAPHDAPAEQYRTLRTRLATTDGGASRRVLAISSPCVGDGKSVTAANLALTMAQEVNRRVVLVDADLRRPSVHTLFGLPQGPGLAAVLAGEVSLEEAVVELPDYRLAVVTAGLPPERPAELLGSAAMRRVLDALRSRFDRVVLDTPPTLPLADVGVIAPMTDGVLLVVRAASTPKPTIERAMGVLDQGRLLGLVLNATGPDPSGYAYYGPTRTS